MKKRNSSKSKDKNKNDKSLKKKRRSSSSGTDSDSQSITDESKSRRNTKKSEKEAENSINNTRVTRHSKRLAAINAGSEDIKDEISDVSVSPVKTGKSSPFSAECKGSPSNEIKKKDNVTPDKHRGKDSEVWKVKSANGAGSGELQKLKICRQRSPENLSDSSKDSESSNNVENENGQNVEEIIINADENKFNNSDENTSNTNEVQIVNNYSSDEIKNESEIKELCDHSDVKDNVANESKEPKISVVTICEVKDNTHVEKEEENRNSSQLTDSGFCENKILKDNDEVPIIEKVNFQSEVEQEENSQAELVLTVEENVIEETLVLNNQCKKTSNSNEKSSELPQNVSNINPKENDMEEVYDYEQDDTKEEGELSANESLSPIHEMFNKYPVEERKRSWGLCSVFNFNRSNLIANEQILKDYKIKKRSISKEDLDNSDPEDLIFVKEIREENIIHEIESETNNTSYLEKDDDVPISPTSKLSNKDTKKKISDGDRKQTSKERIVLDDKSEYRKFIKDTVARSGEGKTVLFISNLTRPFTINQLRELLLRTGRIVEDGFWIDSIKSKCYVQFETEDEAFETRHALHGIRWPLNNPKVLYVQFATQDDLLRAQAQTHESEIPRKTEPLIIENHNEHRRMVDWKKHFEQYDERPRKIKDVREWDIGKPAHPDEMTYIVESEESKQNKHDEDHHRNRKDKRRKNEISDDEFLAKKQKKHNTNAKQSQPEAKLLDDLFKRTKASPSIYWLPLTDEQIVIKQETRRKHLEDIDRQMKKKPDNTNRDVRRGRERRRSRR